MFESNQQTPLQDAELYRFDGRLYELTRRENSLLLRLRSSAMLEKRVAAAVVFSVLAALFGVFSYVNNSHVARPLHGVESFLSYGCVIISLGLAVYWHRLIYNDGVWEFQKYAGRMICRRNGEVSIPMPVVECLRAWQEGGKYYLAVVTPDQEPLQLGSFGFAVKERCWLLDAEEIAEFLGVPVQFE